jgi:hypothetical protein
LTYLDAYVGDDYLGQNIELIMIQDGSSKIRPNIYNADVDPVNITGDGTILNIRFSVSDDAMGTIPIEIFFEAEDKGYVVSKDYADIDTELVGGSVTVRLYNIVFVSKWSSDVFQLARGEKVVLPSIPVNGYNSKIAFKGWSGYYEGMTVDGDMTFEALWVGDVNGDSNVNLRDILSWKIHYSGRDTSDFDDVNMDGKCNLRDMLKIKLIISEVST